jgi:hypothetical protein
LPDEKGMYLLIATNGNKYFRFKYRFAGNEKVLALGVYPATSLKQAREKRDTARDQIDGGIDPSETRKADKIAKSNVFEEITRDWLSSTAHELSAITLHNKTQRFERHAFPVIGDMANRPTKGIFEASQD